MRVKRIEAQVTTDTGERLFFEFSAHDPVPMELTIDSTVCHPQPDEVLPGAFHQAPDAAVNHTLTVDDIRTWRWTQLNGVHLEWANDNDEEST